MKKETAEEAAEKWYDSTEENKGFPKMKAFKEGAKWQQEKSYSEEELIDFAEYIRNNPYVWNHPDKINNKITTKELFEQFKKENKQ